MNGNKQKQGKKDKKDRMNTKHLVVPENQVADPSKLEEYEVRLTYHTKMCEHLVGLIASAKEMREKQAAEDKKAGDSKTPAAEEAKVSEEKAPEEAKK